MQTRAAAISMAKRCSATVASRLCGAMMTAYASEWCRRGIVTTVILVATVTCTAAAFAWLRRRAVRAGDAGVAAAIFSVVLAGLALLARPHFLPLGTGPDLVHHLTLINYIEAHWHLVHDVRLSEYLGEMIDYTPGFHLLAALVGAWTRAGGLRVVHIVVSGMVALKTVLIFFVARRLMPADIRPRDAWAALAVAL